MKLLVATISKCFRAVFHHYSLHAPEHVGQYAGSLLRFDEWDHK